MASFLTRASIVGVLAVPAAAQVVQLPGQTLANGEHTPRWSEITYDKITTHLGFDGDDLWVGTSGGGVYRWDTATDTFEKFTRINDGLPDNVVQDMAVDGADVWVATFYGLAHYDGSSWETITGGPIGVTLSVAVDDAGSLWVGTMWDGLFRYEGGRWLNYTPANSGLSDVLVSSLEVDSLGRLWIGTWFGLDRFDGTTWTNFNPTNSALPSNFVHVKAAHPTDGRVWAWCDDDDFDPDIGTVEFDGDSSQLLTTATSGIHSDYIHSVAVGPTGDVWFQGSSAVSRFDGTAWTTYAGVPSVFDYNFPKGKSLAFHANGDLWAGTAFGLARFTGTDFGDTRATPELRGGHVADLAVDGQGTTWIATFGGLHAHSRADGTWQLLSTADGTLPNDQVEAVAVEAGGIVVAGTHQGAVVYDGVDVTTYTPSNSGIHSDRVIAVASTPAGARWFGTGVYGGGVSRLENDVWTNFTTSNSGLASNSVFRIVVEPEYGAHPGSVWFMTGSGASRFDGTSWERYWVGTGLPHNFVNDVAFDRDGDPWIATHDGLSEVTSGGVTTYTTLDGLPENKVNAVAVDRAGNIWAGHQDGGTSRFDGTSWTVFDRWTGLADNRVHAIAVDRSNTVWFGTEFGVGLTKVRGFADAR